ncbi:PrpF protein [Cyathus striatus]|nr:PrpF protein [Cyathus striatus]
MSLFHRQTQPFLVRLSSSFPSTLSEVANPLPATFLRGGTSKGIFLRTTDLPKDTALWPRIFQGLMGSPDPYGRQLNGMGGGVSSLSKIMVIGPSERDGVDIEYTFVQVGIEDGKIDLSGNCGNLSSMVGVYAVDEGLCPLPKVEEGRVNVRAFNTNTSKIVDTTFPISRDGVPVLDTTEVVVDGVPGEASRIVLEFVNPAGARTGKLFPTGSPQDTLNFSLSSSSKIEVPATLIDATNPTVFVHCSSLSHVPMEKYFLNDKNAVSEVSPILESLRRQGAKKMGLDPEAQAQPKIAILSLPSDEKRVSSKPKDTPRADIEVHALSMGVLHKAVPMTVGLCLGVAAKVKGTIPWEIAQHNALESDVSGEKEFVRIKHPSGYVDVGAVIGQDSDVRSAKVVRTGRRLMKGVVWW